MSAPIGPPAGPSAGERRTPSRAERQRGDVRPPPVDVSPRSPVAAHPLHGMTWPRVSSGQFRPASRSSGAEGEGGAPRPTHRQVAAAVTGGVSAGSGRDGAAARDAGDAQAQPARFVHIPTAVHNTKIPRKFAPGRGPATAPVRGAPCLLGLRPRRVIRRRLARAGRAPCGSAPLRMRGIASLTRRSDAP